MHPSDLSWTFAFVDDAVVVGRCQESPGDLLELSTFTSMYLLRVESAHFAEDTPQTFAVNIKDNITWIFIQEMCLPGAYTVLSFFVTLQYKHHFSPVFLPVTIPGL